MHLKSFNVNREPPVDKTAKINPLEIVETKWIEQRLDHFNPQDRRTWQMRYMENNYYYHEGRPIFIFGEKI